MKIFSGLPNVSFKSFLKTCYAFAAFFGVLSGLVLLFTPEKLPNITNSLSAFGSKTYSLPDSSSPHAIVSDSDAKVLKAFSKVFVGIGKQAKPALVYIESKKVIEEARGPKSLEDFFFGSPFGGGGIPPNGGRGGGQGGERGIQQGAGSGFIVDLKNGYVLTNNHVVADMSELRVQTYDSRWFKAKVVGANKDTDVAVVKLEGFTPQSLKQIALADSDAVEVGDWTIALGAPFGLTQSLTVGVVSATGRNAVMNEESSIEDFIQTDAAINPGNSGGPLLNVDGKVIGINSAIYSRTGSYAGIGFAVPSNVIKTVAEALINDGKVVKGYLGVALTDKPEGADLPENVQGAFVSKVFPKTPAARAGLKPYDLITSFDGQPIRSQSEVRRKIALSKPGIEVPFGILRDGKNITLKIKIGNFDTEGKQAFASEDSKDSSKDSGAVTVLKEFGMAVQELSNEMRKNYHIDAKNGVIVVNIDQGSPASSLFEEGDVIIEINRKAIKSKKDVEKVIADAKQKSKDIVFLIERAGVNQLVVFRNR